MDGTQGEVIPPDKYIVGGDTASEAVISQEFVNSDLQGMYERIMGTSTTAGAGAGQLQKLDSVEQPSVSGTLIHNPTIN